MPRNGLNVPVLNLSPFAAAVAVTLIAGTFAVSVLFRADGMSARRRKILISAAAVLCVGSWLLAALQPHRHLPSFAGTCAILALAVLGCTIAGGFLARSRGRQPILWGVACFGACVLGFALGMLVAGGIYHVASHAGEHAPSALITNLVAGLPFVSMVTAVTSMLAFLGRPPKRPG